MDRLECTYHGGGASFADLIDYYFSNVSSTDNGWLTELYSRTRKVPSLSQECSSSFRLNISNPEAYITH